MPVIYLDTLEAAAQLGITRDVVQELCRKGALPGAIKAPESGGWLIPDTAIKLYQTAHSRRAGRDEHEQPSTVISGDHFQTGNISHSNVSMGRGAVVEVNQGASAKELSDLFQVIYRTIQSRPEDPAVEKEEITQTVQKVETEVAKGDKANASAVARWFSFLAQMAPDILDVTLSALLNPGAAVVEVIKKVAEKAKQDAGKKVNG